jgi:tryptophanyl-tRNA synthetase
MGSNEKKTNNIEINPWGSELIGEGDYVRLCAEFGIQRTEELDIPASVNDKVRSLRRKIIFGHRDFGMIIRSIRESKPWAIMSGIKPSGKFHLGTMLTGLEMIDLQKLGGNVYYAVADIESYEDNGMPFKQAYKNAVDNIADMLSLGLDPEHSYVWMQSQEPIVKDAMFKGARHVTNAMLKAIYGDKLFGLYIASLIQVGDILLPQLKDDVMPTVVPVGIDQDPHLRLTRDLSKHFKNKNKQIFKPGATYHKLLPGLDDVTKKMNKSRPNSYFEFDEEPGKIKKKIMSAFTGGRRNAEEQRKLGGQPEICMVYKLMEFSFEDDDSALSDRYTRCVSGKMLCGQCKKEVADKVLNFIEYHNKRKKSMIPVAKKLLSRKK